MYIVVGVCLAFDVAVMLSWQLIDPFRRDLEDFPHERPESSNVDIEILPQLEHCVSDHLNIWFGTSAIDSTNVPPRPTVSLRRTEGSVEEMERYIHHGFREGD